MDTSYMKESINRPIGKDVVVETILACLVDLIHRLGSTSNPAASDRLTICKPQAPARHTVIAGKRCHAVIEERKALARLLQPGQHI
jgi:hypothetical protein